MGKENAKLEANNKLLEGEINRLKAEVEKMIEENKKFAANNAKLEKQVTYKYKASLNHLPQQSCQS